MWLTVSDSLTDYVTHFLETCKDIVRSVGCYMEADGCSEWTQTCAPADPNLDSFGPLENFGGNAAHV